MQQLALTFTDPVKRQVVATLEDGAEFHPPPNDGWPFIPFRATEGSLGYDLAPCVDVVVPAGRAVVAPTGWSLAAPVPAGYALLVVPRSSLFLKRQLLVANSPGLIDADYQGDLGVVLYNPTADAVTVEAGARVAQLVVVACATPEVAITWNQSEALTRGGFGSTDAEPTGEGVDHERS